MAQERSLSSEQDQAANPTENVWVQANAGTGKTSVLIQRLLRILFRTHGVQPSTLLSGILCLTYTNAGASEMRNRILSALRRWAIASDDDLHDLLCGISQNNPPTYNDIEQARHIFFQYIDTPDLLKIKTIHGFCEEILRRFPLEAGISPAWGLVSDSNQKILLKDTFHRLINSPLEPGTWDTKSDNDTDILLTNAFTHIIGQVSEHSLDDLLAILTAQYKGFFQVNNIVSYRKYFIDTTKYFLDIDFSIQDEILVDNLHNVIENTENDIKSSKKPAAYLINLVNLTKQYIDKTINFEEYKTAYLTANDTRNVTVSKKDYLVDEQERVYQINQHNLNKQVFDDTVALFDLSAAFAHTYQAIKAERNLLDFDDLILYTRKLFSKPDTMGWVLSQLDLGLSHILVDEAQDTSPEQWEILRMLSDDFFTGGDTAANVRSLFVVGDTKQSIYGFQGADPLAFAESREEIATQIRNNMRSIHEIPLTQSFRSTAPILTAVDFFFSNPQITDIANFMNNDHKCFRRGAPGLVELYPIISKNSDSSDS